MNCEYTAKEKSSFATIHVPHFLVCHAALKQVVWEFHQKVPSKKRLWTPYSKFTYNYSKSNKWLSTKKWCSRQFPSLQSLVYIHCSTWPWARTRSLASWSTKVSYSVIVVVSVARCSMTINVVPLFMIIFKSNFLLNRWLFDSRPFWFFFKKFTLKLRSRPGKLWSLIENSLMDSGKPSKSIWMWKVQTDLGTRFKSLATWGLTTANKTGTHRQ